AFFKPERMVVAFAGVKHEDAVKLTEQYFGDMVKAEPPTIWRTESDALVTPTSNSGSQAGENQRPLPSGSPISSTAPSPPAQHSKLLSRIPFFKNLSTSASNNATVSQYTSGLPPPAIDFNMPSHYTGGFISLPPLPPTPNPAL